MKFSKYKVDKMFRLGYKLAFEIKAKRKIGMTYFLYGSVLQLVDTKEGNTY